MKPIFCIMAMTAFFLTGCQAARQTIPVSTNPSGAMVYADGAQICISPCSVKLERRSDHLITLLKDGYEQEDVTIIRRFKPDKALRDGIFTGVFKGGNSEEIGPQIAQEIAKEMDKQERSGEAYELRPTMLTITLQPKID